MWSQTDRATTQNLLMAREDRKKWWFELTPSHEVFVLRESGRLTHKGDEYGEVLRIAHSEKYNDKVKVRENFVRPVPLSFIIIIYPSLFSFQIYFRNRQQPMLLKLFTFDFSANDYSRRFKSVLSNPKSFGKIFHESAGLSDQNETAAENESSTSTASASGISTPSNSTPIRSGSQPPLSMELSSIEERTLSQLHESLQTTPNNTQPETAHAGSSSSGPSTSRGEKRKLQPSGPDAIDREQTSDKEFEAKVSNHLAIGNGSKSGKFTKCPWL